MLVAVLSQPRAPPQNSHFKKKGAINVTKFKKQNNNLLVLKNKSK